MRDEAVIYCRVSSIKQLTEGSGLESQEQRCRMYAEAHGYSVVAVFREKGITGGILDRPAIHQTLTFLQNRSSPTILIIDDLKRFARSVETHIALKAAVAKCGGRLESPSFRFEDTPESNFVETVLAGAAELERNQNRQQVLNRMKARLETGYWAFRCPPGYVMGKTATHRKVMVPDGQRSELIREALTGFASNRFFSLMDVQRFLSAHGFFGSGRRGSVTVELNRVRTMMTEVLYAGFLEYKPWGIQLCRGMHEPLISLETFHKIQDKLAERRSPIKRASDHDEFPLRRLISCGVCGHPLTGSGTTNKGRRYLYYHCYHKGCAEYGKTTGSEDLEREFEVLLRRYHLKGSVLQAARQMVVETWEEEYRDADRRTAAREAEATRIQDQVRELTQKLVILSNETAIRAVEESIVELERKRLFLTQKPAEATCGDIDIGSAFDRIVCLLENPYQTWKSGDTHNKRLITQMLFSTRLTYKRKSGFGSADLSLPYQVLASPITPQYRLVGNTGLNWKNFIVVILKWHKLIANEGN
jgi:site-specific DNA recombinase